MIADTMDCQRRYQNESWLRERYVDQGRSQASIAEECGCDQTTVSRWLSKHNIDARGGGNCATDERLANREWVREQYLEKCRDQACIAEECGCHQATVSEWLSKHNIEARGGGNCATDERLADRDWLREQYVHKGRTVVEIAGSCESTAPTVLRWLDKHNIETRKRGGHTALFGPENPNYNGGPQAYGPGWNSRKKQSVRARDNQTCQDPNCSVTQADHLSEYGQKLHVHHLEKARDISDSERRNAKENLITLCRECHRRWEKIADSGLVPQVDT